MAAKTAYLQRKIPDDEWALKDSDALLIVHVSNPLYLLSCFERKFNNQFAFKPEKTLIKNFICISSGIFRCKYAVLATILGCVTSRQSLRADKDFLGWAGKHYL